LQIIKAIDILTEQRKNLKQIESYEVAYQIMNGNATDAQIASILTGLKMKGETTDEIYGFVKAMREKSIKLNIDGKNLIDTCGTGGDRKNTFNISTISAFVVAGAGGKVAKHGNRSISSKCGSADLLKKLGANIMLNNKRIEESIRKTGIGFLFAPSFHPAMRYVMNSRKELKVKTIFNILGPLTNPANTKRQIIGVFEKKYTEIFAKILKKFKSEHCLVVHGDDGLDELTITDRTKITELKNNTITTYYIQPEDFGLQRAPLSKIKGKNPKYNAEIALSILSGDIKDAKRDIILLNSAASIYVAGLSNSIKDGIDIATDTIDSGKAIKKLLEFIKFTRDRNL